MRGALRILESDGLVHIERGTKGGPRVIAPDITPLARRVGLLLQLRGTNLREVIEAQAVIQPGVVALAASAHEPGDIDQLRSAADRSAAATSMDDYLEAVTDFTDALMHAAHNEALTLFAEITRSLQRQGLDAMVAEQHIELSAVHDLVERAVRHFRGVVDLIEQRDAAGAEAYWREFLQDTGAAPPTAPLEVYPSNLRG
jgi:GntR family transcriptional regulator, transcriptional repressor for pyruvate dehydrogenase complex